MICTKLAGFLPEFLQLVVHLCIINNLEGLVNNGCGKLHVRELQIHDTCSCNAREAKQKQKLVKGQLTLFVE